MAGAVGETGFLEQNLGRGAETVTFRAGRTVGLKSPVGKQEPDLLAVLTVVGEELKAKGIIWTFEPWKPAAAPGFVYIPRAVEWLTQSKWGTTSLNLNLRRPVVPGRGGYRSYPREMTAGIRENGQFDWPRFLVVEEGNDVTSPLSSRRLDSTRRPTDLA